MKKQYETPLNVWTRLDGVRRPMMLRLERYAAMTHPKLLLPEGITIENMDQTHDFNSIGAQAVNHVTNKIMLALFAPTRPCFRLQPTAEAIENMGDGVTEADIAAAMAVHERNGMRRLDALSIRPKLYDAVKRTVVTGQAVLAFEGTDKLRVHGIRNFCVKRCKNGDLHTLVIRECIRFDELEDNVQDILAKRYQPDSEVQYFKLIERQPKGRYRVTQAVDSTVLPEEFDGFYRSYEALPYKVVVWDLADESDYATGLVEEYAGDFEALSIMAEGTVSGGTLAAEFRWLVNPTGMTSIEDFRDSKNGDAIPGTEKDVTAAFPKNADGLRVLMEISDKHERRVGRGFLLNSAVTRDAERVTAEEIRMTAQELETAYGGVYSGLAVCFQKPVAQFLLKGLDLEIKGKSVELAIVTGLDGLSRNGDVENFRLAMDDLSALNNVPPWVQERFKGDPITRWVGAGRQVDLGQFLKTDAQVEQDRAAMQQMMAQQEGMNALAASAGQAAGEAAPV